MDPTASTARIEELLTHADWVRALARNLSRDDADADDLSQETWLAALRGAPRQTGPAWLGGVARNLSRMRWRSAARRARREERAASERTPPPAPDEVVARMEMQRLLADAVLRLDEPWRSTVVQRYLDGRTSAEIARREGVPAATVRGRLKTALERLREDLDRRHDGRRDAWRVGFAPVLGISPAEIRSAASAASTGAGAAPVALGVLGALVLGAGLLAFLFAARDPGGGASPSRPAEPVGAPPDAREPGPVDEKPPQGVRWGAVADPRSEDEGDEPTPEAPPARLATPQDFEYAGTPAGMAYVPRGTAILGTTYERLRQDLLQGRARQVQADFAFEAPQHQVEMAPYFIDRYEVTNAQYLLFLQETRETYNTDAAALANLAEVAGHLLDMPRERWDEDEVAWGQLYESNRALLWEKMPGTVVKNQAGEVDEKATKQAFRYAPLVRGMELEFYDRKPPETWPSMEPLKIFLDHPVMSVSYDDAEAFAEWAGKHVPTEQEWEYAGRGPEGYYWPWGDQWYPDLSRANWGAKNIDDQFKPRTMSVDTLPEGRSWCGVYHMLGNAGEWTSSWFGPYPGNEREHVSMGEYVKVIRGATYVDLELLVLRLAARNFIGQGVKAPPRPGNRFEYIGFRCAWTGQPGLDHLGPILRRVSRGRRITQKSLAMDQYAAAVATRFAPPGAEVEHHVTVQGRAHAVVVVPLTSMLRPDQRTPRIRSRADLETVTAKADDPLPLAVLHTDLPLVRVYVRDRSTPGGRPGPRTAPPPVKEDVCPPGTYVLGVWHTRLCLCTSALELVCFLTRDEAHPARLDVVGLVPEGRKAARLVLDEAAGGLSLDFEVPVGGASTSAEQTVVVNGLVVTPQAGALQSAGPWRTHSRSDD